MFPYNIQFIIFMSLENELLHINQSILDYKNIINSQFESQIGIA